MPYKNIQEQARYQRKWEQKNRKKRTEYMRKWREKRTGKKSVVTRVISGRDYKKEYCYFCDKKTFTDTHHIDKDRKNNTPRNLVELCPSCHQKLHKRIYGVIFKRGRKV